MAKMAGINQVLSRNLEALLKDRGWSNRELARQTGGRVSDRYIGMILHQDYAAGLDVIDNIARAFKVETWMLIFPGLDLTLTKDNKFKRLAEGYNKAGPDARNYMLHILEKENA